MENNILMVIDELGGLLKQYKDEIKFKDIQIKHLNDKIDQIEQYISYYTENKEA